jgi:hypothetical protein
MLPLYRQVLAPGENQWWENRKGSSRRVTTSVTGSWRANSEALHAKVAFRVPSRKYLIWLCGSRQRQGFRRGSLLNNFLGLPSVH